MSLNEKKKQAEALLRSNWCKINEFHDWRMQTSWSCGACINSQVSCTFSNPTATHCDNCPSAGCTARLEFRKAFFMQKFGIPEKIYETWTYEWRNEKKKASTEVKGKGSQSNHKQPPPQVAIPQGGAPGPSHRRSEGKAKKPQFTATSNSAAQASTSSGWGAHAQPSNAPYHAPAHNQLQGPSSAPMESIIPHSSISGHISHTQLAVSTSSIDQLIDNQIKFFTSMREASDRHLKVLADFQAERRRASSTEQGLKEQVRSLEEKLRESQEGQEFLRSRLKNIVQDLQVEVQRGGLPPRGQGSQTRSKGKEEDFGELSYPS
ncbi:hypothetical protein ONZ45_g4239 [Pleurotus djamor]|nr:hypothetical protein ONZ45_g4239 [Pleurotus djamor]